jgi:hypothetical protein
MCTATFVKRSLWAVVFAPCFALSVEASSAKQPMHRDSTAVPANYYLHAGALGSIDAGAQQTQVLPLSAVVVLYSSPYTVTFVLNQTCALAAQQPPQQRLDLVFGVPTDSGSNGIVPRLIGQLASGTYGPVISVIQTVQNNGTLTLVPLEEWTKVWTQVPLPSSGSTPPTFPPPSSIQSSISGDLHTLVVTYRYGGNGSGSCTYALYNPSVSFAFPQPPPPHPSVSQPDGQSKELTKGH